MTLKAVLGVACAFSVLVLALPSRADTYVVAPGQTQTQSSQITGAANSVTVTGGGTLLLTNAANSYGGGTIVNDATTLQVTVDGDLGAAASGLTLGDAALGGTLDLSASTSAVTSSCTFSLNAGGGTILTGTGGAWTLTGAISGPGALTVNGSGNLILGGGNVYTGGTNLNGGTLTVSSDGNLGNGGTVAMAAGTTLAFTAGGSYSHAITLSGDPTFSVATGLTVTYGGLLADGTSAGQLNVTGGGTLALTNAANSYSGGTAIAGGSTLSVGSDSVLGAATGPLTLGDATTSGTLDTTSSTAAVASLRNMTINSAGTVLVGANTWTLNGGIAGGPLSVNGGGELVLTDALNSFPALNIAGNSTVQAATDGDLGSAVGVVTLGDAVSSGTVDFTTATAAVSSSRNFTINNGGGTFLAGTNAWTLGGIISGGGGMTVGGGGTLILSGINTYAGNTTVIGGSTLQIGADSNLGGSPNGTVTLGDATTSGTLALTASSITARIINFASGGATINNTGYWTFGNYVTGSGPLTVTGTGTLVLDAPETYTGLTTLTGGTLMVGDSATPGASIPGNVTITGGSLTGFGTIAGLVTNTSGFVAPSGVNLPLTLGSFTQGATGTTSITVTPAGATLLNINGNAALAGTLALNFQGYFHTQTLDLINARTVTGAFTTVSGTLSNSVSQQLVYNVISPTLTEIELVLTQIALGQNPSIYPAITTVAVNAAQADNDNILGRLTELRTETVVDDMPMADSRMHRAGLGAGSSPYGAWFKALGGVGSAGGNNGAPGFTTRGGGFITGVDLELTPGVVGGVAVSYTRSSISETGGASGNVDTPRFMIYSGWWHGPLALDATLGYGFASFNANRPIAAAGGSAGSSFKGGEITSAVQASSPLHFGALAFTPSVGMDYARLKETTAYEAGAGSYDLSVMQSKTNSLRPFVAGMASTRFYWGDRWVVEPMLRLAYESEVLGTSRQALVQPIGDSQVFTVPGATPASGTVAASAGVKIETDHSLAIFANLDATSSGSSRNVGGDAGVRYRF